MGHVRERIRRKGRRGTLPPITAVVFQNQAELSFGCEAQHSGSRGRDRTERGRRPIIAQQCRREDVEDSPHLADRGLLSLTA